MFLVVGCRKVWCSLSRPFGGFRIWIGGGGRVFDETVACWLGVHGVVVVVWVVGLLVQYCTG